MRGLPTIEERRIFSMADKTPACRYPRVPREPKTIAMMSVLPGLGQLYNGEIGKGLMFLLVSLVNAVFVLSVLFSWQVIGWLANLAIAFHMQPDLAQARSLVGASAASPAFYIYLLIVISFICYAMRDAYDHATLKQHGSIYQPFFMGLPEAASGSYFVHFGVLTVGLILAVFFAKPLITHETVTTIELEQPPPPAPKPKPPEIVKKSTQPVTKPPVVPPQPMPVAVVTTNPTAIAEPISAAPVMATPAPPSAASDAGPPAQDVDMGPYLADLQRRIKKAWYPPKGNESKRIVVFFKLRKNGEISGLKLKISSGVGIADDAALTAVETAAPYAYLPAGAGEEIDINFTFDYSVFGGRHSDADTAAD